MAVRKGGEDRLEGGGRGLRGRGGGLGREGKGWFLCVFVCVCVMIHLKESTYS